MIRTADNLTIQITVALLVMCVMVCPVQARSIDRVQLKSSATSDDHLIQLREIAYLTGDTAQKLGGSVVAELADSQTQTRITLRMVEKHLSAMGVNWGRLNLAGAVNCQVQIGDATSSMIQTAIASNPNKTITTDDALTVQKHVENYLLQYTGYSDQELVVKFSSADQRQLQVPALLDRFEIQVAGSAKLGRLPLTIRRWRGATRVSQTRVTAEVSYKTLALVAINNIRRGDQFSPNDLQVQEVELHSDHAKPLRKLSEVVGFIASRSIRKKQTLLVDDIRPALVIRRGQMVTIRAIVGGMVIRTTARAMTDAAMDEMVQLKNERSRESFMARVIGPREAVIQQGNTSQLSMAGRAR